MASISVYGYDPAMSDLIDSASRTLITEAPHSEKPKAAISRNDTGFPFLRLPFELRKQILDLVLPSSFAEGYKGWVWQKGNTAILSTCQQIHQEGTRIIYSSNTFVISIHFDHVNFLCQWYSPKLSATCHRSMHLYTTLSSRYLGLMRKFNFRIYGVDDYSGMVKYGISNLEALALGFREQLERVCEFIQKGSDDLDVLVFFRGMNSNLGVAEEPYRGIIIRPLKAFKGKVDVDSM